MKENCESDGREKVCSWFCMLLLAPVTGNKSSFDS